MKPFRNSLKPRSAMFKSIPFALLTSTWLGLGPALGQATTTVQLPAATVTSVGNVAVQIAPQNPGRRTFSICNGSANSIYANPGTATGLTTTGGGALIAINTCLSPPPNAVQSGTVLGGGNSWFAIGTAAGPTIVSFIEW